MNDWLIWSMYHICNLKFKKLKIKKKI